jgi:hypothetical protein
MSGLILSDGVWTGEEKATNRRDMRKTGSNGLHDFGRLLNAKLE